MLIALFTFMNNPEFSFFCIVIVVKFSGGIYKVPKCEESYFYLVNNCFIEWYKIFEMLNYNILTKAFVLVVNKIVPCYCFTI